MKKKILFSLIMCAALLAFTGCASTVGLSASKVKKACTEGEWLSPSEGTLVFGYCTAWNDFLQQNPNIGYKFHNVNARVESYWCVLFNLTFNVSFLEPLPVGSELKLFSSTYSNGRNTTTYYYGIAGVDVVCDKPGLLFYNGGEENPKDELKALKMLYTYFKGTGSEWEQTILDRMEELNNEK